MIAQEKGERGTLAHLVTLYARGEEYSLDNANVIACIGVHGGVLGERKVV